MRRKTRTQFAAVCFIGLIFSGIGLYRIHRDEKERVYRNERVQIRIITGWTLDLKTGHRTRTTMPYAVPRFYLAYLSEGTDYLSVAPPVGEKEK